MRRRARRGVGATAGGERERRGEHPARRERVAAEHDALDRGHPAERLGRLERPREPDAGDLVGRPAEHRPSGDGDLPAIGDEHPGDDVDDRRLAGAVRADERGDRARAEVDVDLLHRHQRAEAPGDPADGDDRLAQLQPSPSRACASGAGAATAGTARPVRRPRRRRRVGRRARPRSHRARRAAPPRPARRGTRGRRARAAARTG